jgi:hypothetical protein
MNTDLELTTCPECGRPAEIVQRVTLPSTDGPVAHVKTRCVTGPWFFVPAADVAPLSAPRDAYAARTGAPTR